jgi:hypothetical protein
MGMTAPASPSWARRSWRAPQALDVRNGEPRLTSTLSRQNYSGGPSGLTWKKKPGPMYQRFVIFSFYLFLLNLNNTCVRYMYIDTCHKYIVTAYDYSIKTIFAVLTGTSFGIARNNSGYLTSGHDRGGLSWLAESGFYPNIHFSTWCKGIDIHVNVCSIVS